MFNPVKTSKNIKDEFINYIDTTYSLADDNLRKQFREQLSCIISAGPYLETNDVFKTGESIRQLIDDGVLSPLFLDLESNKIKQTDSIKPLLPVDRPLYKHQEKAIRAIVNGENIVISTGTGSGKTNCFLIPVLNELLREKEAGTLGPGIRALFIYPMNALANDQLKNIRKILMDYPDITFGVYNGGTEYEEEDATRVYESMFATEPIERLRHPLENELLSRDQMKETPPNILFTNYAMLEHLLFRPNDDILFSRADFHFVVLDEAHVYSGATGIETAILLNRLRARIVAKGKTQFILTSATLGRDESSNSDIVTFAKNLCGVSFKEECIIRGERQEYVPAQNTIDYSYSIIHELANEENDVQRTLDKYGIHHDSQNESEMIYDFVNASSQYHKLRKGLKGKVTPLQKVFDLLDAKEDECIDFLSLCSKAKKAGKSLIDVRYHFFIRSLEGCFITLSPTKKLLLNRQKAIDNYTFFEIAICNDCGNLALVGKIKDGFLVQANKPDENIEYFYFDSQNNHTIEDEDEEESGDEEKYYLCPHCGAIIEKDRIKNKPCDCNQEEYIVVVKTKKTKSDSAPKCHNCHRGKYNRFYLGNDAATSVLATALYEELPELYFEKTITPKTTSNLFLRAMSSGKKELRSRCRQFLVFSDSRQEAAKFACYLGKSYEEFLRRRGICHIVKEHRYMIVNKTITVSGFVDKLTSYFTNKRSFAQSYADYSDLTIQSNRNAWVAMLNELARANSSTSLTALGVLHFEYIGNEPLIEPLASQYHVDDSTAKALLDLLAFEVVKAGAICADNDTDINDNDREYIFYTPSQKFITKLQSPDRKISTITNWMPRTKNGNPDDFYMSNRLYFVIKALGVSPREAATLLNDYFDYLIDSNNNPYHMVDKNHDGTYVMPAKNFRVVIPGCKETEWYRCPKCGRVSPFHLKHKCSTVNCESPVKPVDPVSLRTNNHFANLYFSESMSPLFIKEHTAQLSKHESAEYQEQFIKKEINALSCSTTFEMGVDVGDLETVFLRDVPPLPSNYAQRAGRAGRSINAAAFCLTFAKLSSHDLSFFKSPEQMINGEIVPPLFKVDNEKIVKRHVYDVALSMFFADNPDLYNRNNAAKFINEKGYLKFIDWLNSKPERLKKMLQLSIPDIDNLHARIGINNFGWLDHFIGEEGTFTLLLREYEGNIEQFDKLIKRFKRENDLTSASICERKRNRYMSNKLIEFLARGNVLPRYGFPVDTVELEQNTTADNIHKLRLSRDLSMAIAEYAPSSEVIADGKLYTSRYIKKSNLGNDHQDWLTGYIGKCQNEKCQAINYSVTPISKDGIKCASCGELLYPMDFHESIEPTAGFATDGQVKDVPLSRQEKNYRSEDVYIGNTESKTINKFCFDFNGIDVEIESTTNDSLMVRSYTDFYVCPKCGYAISDDERISNDATANNMIENHHSTVIIKKPHPSLYGRHECDCHELKRYSMHHIFNTDVAKINFSCDTSDYKTMVSVMYAILYAFSDYLNIERKDIKACLSWKVIDHVIHYSIILYDAVPGGAGHSRRLVTNDGQLLRTVFRKAFKNMTSCNCNPSCYNCLRSYENQKIHEDLDRNLAAEFLAKLI